MYCLSLSSCHSHLFFHYFHFAAATADWSFSCTHMWCEIVSFICSVQYIGSSITDQNKLLSWVWMWPSYISFWAVPCTACAAHMMVCCICLDAVFCTTVIAHPLFYFWVVQSHCFSVTSLHHSLMCVLFCSALSSLLLLHPLWAACTWGLLCFQLYLSLPLQEWTSKSTFRSVRRRNDRGSIAGIDWRRAEVWIRARQIGTVFREGLCIFCLL